MYLGRLPAIAQLVWFAALLVATIACCLQRRAPVANRAKTQSEVAARAVRRPQRRTAWLLLLPALAAAALSIWIFTILRTSPLLQYNEMSDRGTQAFEFWGCSWFLFLPAHLVAALLALILSVTAVRSAAYSQAVARFAVALANGVTLSCVLQNFPSV